MEQRQPVARHFTIDLLEHDWRQSIKDFKADYVKRDLPEVNEALENRIYALALHGVKLPVIANLYNVDYAQLREQYNDVWRAGNAELQAMIAAATVEFGLTTQQPVAKIWLGKAMGGLTDTPTIDVASGTVVSESSSANVNLNINMVSRATHDSTRTDIDLDAGEAS